MAVAAGGGAAIGGWARGGGRGPQPRPGSGGATLKPASSSASRGATTPTPSTPTSTWKRSGRDELHLPARLVVAAPARARIPGAAAVGPHERDAPAQIDVLEEADAPALAAPLGSRAHDVVDVQPETAAIVVALDQRDVGIVVAARAAHCAGGAQRRSAAGELQADGRPSRPPTGARPRLWLPSTRRIYRSLRWRISPVKNERSSPVGSAIVYRSEGAGASSAAMRARAAARDGSGATNAPEGGRDHFGQLERSSDHLGDDDESLGWRPGSLPRSAISTPLPPAGDARRTSPRLGASWIRGIHRA